ncbi:hypothetical protein BKA59DRAFT_559041 [Fusarium tricinctum]|uniref:Uncharacterized protein n=1 Tax=Fusarium tricinctum TaxID=61284 RepID=A0A8K0RK99_9HYPO|nr:hypothetical protein BKA59DRAFT_559041 [Fusarium tricinctum]
MSQTVQFPDEEAINSEVFERIPPLNLNFHDPEDVIAIPTNYASRAVMDDYIQQVVDKMKEVREEFSVMAAKGLIDSDYVASVLHAVQAVVDAMILNIKRHYHQREEGLRTRREREYAAISRTGCFNRIKRTFVTISYSMDIHALIMKMEEEKRTNILLDAFKKLRLHSQIATLTDGGSEPHWNWSLA